MCLNLIKVKHKLKCFFESKVDRCKTREHHVLAPPVLLLEVTIAPTWGVGSTGEWVPASWAHHFTISPLKYPSLSSRSHFSNHKDPPNQHIAKISFASWILKPTSLISCLGLQMVIKIQVLDETKHWKLPAGWYWDGVGEPGESFSWVCSHSEQQAHPGIGVAGQWVSPPGFAYPRPSTSKRRVRSPGSCCSYPPVSTSNGRTSKTPLKGSKALHCTHTNSTTHLPPCQRLTPTILSSQEQ